MKEHKGASSDAKRAAEPRTTTEKEGADAASTGANPASPPRPKYEFKILPVDPKNNFDFEDVADK